MIMQVRGLAVASVVLVLVAAAPLSGQEHIAAARAAYESAEYEHALQLLDGLSAESYPREDRQAVELYRALCLLAVGRRADAERSIEAMIAQDPLYRPTVDVPPRVRSAFIDAKTRILPAIVKQHYGDAKAAFDRQDFDLAASRFKRVIEVLKDPDMTVTAKQPPLSDLGTLAAGFYDLSVKALPPPSPPQPVEPPVTLKPAPTIYTGEDPSVAPPIVIRQDLPKFPAAVRPGGLRGIMEVLVNEEGGVEATSIIVPTTDSYDKLLLEAAANWQYVPASVDGTPVKFRRRIQINIADPRGLPAVR
jgi:hypothetical protein